MRIGGGSETWMIAVPVVVGLIVTVIVVGPDRVWFVLEKMTQDAWSAVGGLIR